MRPRVVVTGLGAVSPLGLSAEASWEAALAGRSGVRTIEFYDSSPMAIRIAGQVPEFDLRDYVEPRFEVIPGNRRVRFGLAATEMALADAGLLAREPSAEEHRAYCDAQQR